MATSWGHGIWIVDSTHQAQEHLSTCPQPTWTCFPPLTAGKPRSLLEILLL